jgi:hypothetical protein
MHASSLKTARSAIALLYRLCHLEFPPLALITPRESLIGYGGNHDPNGSRAMLDVIPEAIYFGLSGASGGKFSDHDNRVDQRPPF